jgi:hypothetical protein
MHLLGDQDPSQNPNIQAILEAKAHGRRTILNLKWNYETEPFPTAGSAAMTQELDQLNRVLPVVMGKVDILVIASPPGVSRPAAAHLSPWARRSARYFRISARLHRPQACSPCPMLAGYRPR